MLYWYRSYVLLCVSNDNLLVSNTTRVARWMGGGAGKGCPFVPCPHTHLASFWRLIFSKDYLSKT